jgi:hypothetical protein
MAEPPSGAVTFLFSDIEGSTRLVNVVRVAATPETLVALPAITSSPDDVPERIGVRRLHLRVEDPSRACALEAALGSESATARASAAAGRCFRSVARMWRPTSRRMEYTDPVSKWKARLRQ